MSHIDTHAISNSLNLGAFRCSHTKNRRFISSDFDSQLFLGLKLIFQAYYIFLRSQLGLLDLPLSIRLNLNDIPLTIYLKRFDIRLSLVIGVRRVSSSSSGDQSTNDWDSPTFNERSRLGVLGSSVRDISLRGIILQLCNLTLINFKHC